MTGLREALAAKRVRETTYPVVIADPQPAQQKLAELRSRDALARLGKSGEDADLRKLAAEILAVEAEIAGCYYALRLRAIHPADLEALIAEHTDHEEGRVDLKAMLPDLLAAAAVDSDLTSADWAAELDSGRWSDGDLEALRQAAWDVNRTPVSEGLPKG